MRALIGYTGFVGAALMKVSSFDRVYNTANIEDIAGESFAEVICAGAWARKWWANANPEQDLQSVMRLIDCLATASIDRFILISTVDVYPIPINVTESSVPKITDLGPYGRHRLLLENRVRQSYKRHHVVRLPGLFGDGLKKNAIFDLQNQNQIQLINPSSTYQWYPIDLITDDLATIVKNDLRLTNITSEPILIDTLIREFFPQLNVGKEAGKPATYDVRSEYAERFGGERGYVLNKDRVFTKLEEYIRNSRGRHA